jgi:hypothetical protein
MRRSLVVAMAGLAAAAFLATGAMAQPAPADGRAASSVPSNTPDDGAAELAALGERPAVSPQESYDEAIMALKQKMERLTREDGGQLSAAHQASLQKELDEVNRRFHAGPSAQAH